MKIDVENIDKDIKKIWIPIYEVIDAPFLKKRTFYNSIFRPMLKNPNQHNFLPSDVKTVMKIIATEQRLYEQVVMIRQKGLDSIKEKETTKKYNLQGKSARPNTLVRS